MVRATTLQFLVSMASLSGAVGNFEAFLFSNPAAPDQTPRFLRNLQTSQGNLPDIIADSSLCETRGGKEFACRLHQRVGPDDNYMDINVTVFCELGVAQFDFRRSSGCGCVARMTPLNQSRIVKDCKCFVCPRGFGSSSVSIDCIDYVEVPTNRTIAKPYWRERELEEEEEHRRLQESPAPTSLPPTVGGGVSKVPSSSESPSVSPAPSITPMPTASAMPSSDVVYDPFIFSTCVSVDCAANCNGTCSLGCSNSGPACAFCEGAEGSPTQAPTGQGGGGVPTFGGGTVRNDGSTSAAASARIAAALKSCVLVWTSVWLFWLA